MYTIQDLMHIDKIEAEARGKLKTEANTLSLRAAGLKREMDKAAEAGDLAGYGKADTERRAILARLDHLRGKLRKPAIELNRGEVLETWREYAEAYNVTFGDKLQDYEAARHELAVQFLKLVKMQAEALKVRDKLNEALHHGDPNWLGIGIDPALADLETIPTNSRNAEAQYFCQYDVDRSMYGDIIEIVNRHIPVDLDRRHSGDDYIRELAGLIY